MKDSAAEGQYCCVRDPAGNMQQLIVHPTRVPSATVQSVQRYPSFLSES